MRRKVCVVVTARPSYSRIKSVLTAIEQHSDLQLQLVVAASALLDRYGSAINVIKDDGFEVAAQVYMVVEGENPAAMAKTTGLGLVELSTIFDNLKPDVVVTIADRYETVATAVAAAFMNIPLAHVQGGEVTGSIDEKVRHTVTKLSDLHFVANRKAAERVIRMGENPKTVFVTGCPSIDLVTEMLNSPALDFDPFTKYGGVGTAFDLSRGYLVVMQHPVTTEHEKARDHILETLYAVKTFDLPALVFWPNVDAGSDGTSNGIRTFRELENPANFHFFKNMVPTDFLKLIFNSRGLIGNSSVGIRESSFLGSPVVNIGSRQCGRERGSNVIDVTYDRQEIAGAISHHLGNGHYPRDPIYGEGTAGKQIAQLLSEVPLSIEKRLAY
jgi:UDP-hydrolysing UDP-N-acetyl-D-glucosamine 2-epimerase